MADAADQAAAIEIFLRNALREKRLEDRVVRQVMADLRSTLLAVERSLVGSGIFTPSPGRDRQIAQLVSAVANSVQRIWGAPTLGQLQTSLVPWFEGQMEFARRLVRASGGTLTAEGAANASPTVVANAVNNAIVNGKTLAATLTQSLPVLIADRVERMVRLGLQDAAGQVAAVYQDAVVVTTERNVEAIIRTGVHEVGSTAQQMIYELETDPAWMAQNGLVWTAVLDSDVCPICLGLDGNQYKLGESAPYFDGSNKISPHLNCVLEGTSIEPGILAAAVRAEYSGEVVTVSTEGGRMLSVTENHPVLTLNGWKPAKLLEDGDQLICRGTPVESVVNPGFNQCPALAEQIFAFAGHVSTVELSAVPASTMDFHGDGARVHGDVNIAVLNRNLLINAEAMCPEHVSDALFVVADSQLTQVDGPCSLDAFLLTAHATATGFIGSSDLVTTLLLGHRSPLQLLRIALRARCDTSFDQPFSDGATVDTKLLRDLVLAHAGAVELDNVVNVQVDTKSHVTVYDFSTLSGAYFAEGILTHNCRCYLIPQDWYENEERIVDGDKGEARQTFKVAAKKWIKDNPDTTRAIFGKNLGNQLLDGKIGFDKAIKIWTAPKRAS